MGKAAGLITFENLNTFKESLMNYTDARYTKAITAGAIHGMFVESIEGGLKYNGSEGEFTIMGAQEIGSVKIEGANITLGATEDANEIKVVGLDKATITIGEEKYKVADEEAEPMRRLEKIGE